MQHKPDKEWDNLFRNKFEDAEITPSANVWENIEANYHLKKGDCYLFIGGQQQA